MKKLTTLLFLGFILNCFSQYKTNHSPIYEVGDSLRFEVRYSIGGGNKPFANASLDSLTQFILNNPEISFTVNSHTDSRGSAAANLKLSQMRAESIVNYLVKTQNLEKDRLTAVGWGESKPIIPNKAIEKYKHIDKEKFNFLHQKNRRTVLIITSISQKIIGNYPSKISIPSYYSSDSILKIGDKIKLDPFHFQLGSIKLSYKNYPGKALRATANFILENRDVTFQINCHSDHRSSNLKSVKRSVGRAKELYSILTEVYNVPVHQISYKGFEDTAPIIPLEKFKNKTIEEKEKLHQINRRVELEVIAIKKYNSERINTSAKIVSTNLKSNIVYLKDSVKFVVETSFDFDSLFTSFSDNKFYKSATKTYSLNFNIPLSARANDTLTLQFIGKKDGRNFIVHEQMVYVKKSILPSFYLGETEILNTQQFNQLKDEEVFASARFNYMYNQDKLMMLKDSLQPIKLLVRVGKDEFVCVDNLLSNACVKAIEKSKQGTIVSFVNITYINSFGSRERENLRLSYTKKSKKKTPLFIRKPC